jgi:hypothetical protein
MGIAFSQSCSMDHYSGAEGDCMETASREARVYWSGGGQGEGALYIVLFLFPPLRGHSNPTSWSMSRHPSQSPAQIEHDVCLAYSVT